MKLNVVVTGPDAPAPALPPVLLAHGLFGQSRNLGMLARRLSDTRTVLSVDMRNHGDSFDDPDHSYDAMAGDLARVIADHGGQADVVGHSMGGKASMWLALTRPDCVRRLAVLDIAPVAYGHTQTEVIDALESVDLSQVATRLQADAALDGKIEDPSVRGFLLQSLDVKAQPPVWKLNLPVLRDQMEGLTGWPGHEGKRFDGPVLVLAGGDSDYVKRDYEDAIHQAFPAARIQRIAGTSHWLHAERPGEVTEAVAAFLS